ncbi:hypothetical protein V8E51_006856 [Hyaloscypha variabilis]
MPPQPVPQQEYARVVLIIVLLFFLYASPDPGPPPGFPTARDYAAERIAVSRRSLDILNITKWQDFSPKGPDTPKHEAPRYLNLTGFREDDDYAWERLDAFRKRSSEYSDEARGKWRGVDGNENGLMPNVYENVTGIVAGRWVRRTADINGEPRKRAMNLTEITPETDWAFQGEEYWIRNITGNEGKLMLRLDEKQVDEVGSFEDLSLSPIHAVRSAVATLTIQDETSSGDGWEMRLHGLHWPKQGTMLFTTTSDKFHGIYGLPHLTSSREHYLSGQKLLNRTLEKAIEGMEQAIWADPANPFTSSPDSQGDATMPVPHCELVVYAQVYPLKVDLASSAGHLDPANIVQQIEQEIRFPNGAPIPDAPRLQVSTVMFSPDCGFMIESKGPPDFSPGDGEHLLGKKQELFLQDIQSWLHVFALVIFAQIMLLKIQSKEASTPSTIGRVSLFTVAIMLMADALLFSSLSLLSATAPNLFPAALLTSFTALMSVALGVRFVGAIYQVQEPERRERLRTQQTTSTAPARPNATPARAPTITAAGADTLAHATDAPIIIPSDQDIDLEIAENTTVAAPPLLPTTNTPATTTQTPRNSSSFGAIYVKFILVLTFLLFISLSSTSWPIPVRTFYVNTLSFIYLSIWIPQIRRNITRNCRKALLWKFIIGQSILRLLPFAYFYLKEDNILFADTDWKAFCVLAGWVWVQIWVLVAQEILGPRWGLPKNWYEEGWDYHPILREDNVEAGGLPIGLVQIPGSPTLERARTSEELGRKKKDGGVRTVDCAICMQVLEVPVVGAGEDSSANAGGVAGILARRLYMVTPCRHVFHSACLEGWMRFRLQCPICRENLPPL